MLKNLVVIKNFAEVEETKVCKNLLKFNKRKIRTKKCLIKMGIYILIFFLFGCIFLFLVISKKKVKFGEINEIDRNLNSNWKLEKFQMQSFSQRLNQPTNQLTNRLTACKD